LGFPEAVKLKARRTSRTAYDVLGYPTAFISIAAQAQAHFQWFRIILTIPAKNAIFSLLEISGFFSNGSF
jgi:hypothetical protein